VGALAFQVTDASSGEGIANDRARITSGSRCTTTASIRVSSTVVRAGWPGRSR
jgi:hypothetical protein